MTQSNERIQHVLVVGGGTAGWLTASHLAKKLRSNTADGIRVTLVESADIPTIGVGEGTVPAIRQSLEHLGIRETDFIRECDATFKQSIKFVDWLKAPAEGDGRPNYYHHVFDYPAQTGTDLTAYWLLGHAHGRSYVDAVSAQGQVCDRGYGPKLMTHAEYDGLTSYAYHLDAAKFARLLTRHATENLGVDHKLANVTAVNMTAEGDVASITTDAFGEIEADVFVDCTGFRALMIEGKIGVPFIDKSDQLFVNRAIAVQAPYSTEEAPIPCHTVATAKEAGWIWDIGLTERRGTGYVYSSSHTSDTRAEAVIRHYLAETIGAEKAEKLDSRVIPMKIGYRQEFWKRNVIAIGLSQGFVEPLEATGLLVFDATARMLAEQFPATRNAMDGIAARFNSRVRYAWDRVIDFIKLHYCLSQREDSDFWRDNRDLSTISDHLKANLEHWRHQPPSEYDFSSKLEIFNLDNYLYVLYGMDFQTAMDPIAFRYPDGAKAERDFAELQRMTEHLTSRMIPHRDLVTRIKQHGLQRI